MGIKTTAKNVATGTAGIALASVGCSTCADSGAVDPAPPPFVCTDAVKQGASLFTSATFTTPTVFVVEIGLQDQSAQWVEAQILNPEPVTVLNVQIVDPHVRVTLKRADTLVTSGSFTLQAKAKDSSFEADGSLCDINRTFTFTIDETATIQVAQVGADKLPLAARHRAVIAMRQQDAHSVELKATTTFSGPCRLAWSVSGGTVVGTDGNAAHWRLPKRKGLYQAQVVADFGDEGLAFDAITVEVG